MQPQEDVWAGALLATSRASGVAPPPEARLRPLRFASPRLFSSKINSHLIVCPNGPQLTTHSLCFKPRRPGGTFTYDSLSSMVRASLGHLE